MADHPLFPENWDGIESHDVTPQLDYPAGTPWIDEVQVSVELPMGPAGPEGPVPTFGVHQTVNVPAGVTGPTVTVHQGMEHDSPPGDGVWYFDFFIPRGRDGKDGAVGPPLRILGDWPGPEPTPPDSPAPPGTQIGDAWLVGYDLYVWNGTSWVVAEDYRGPMGPTGRAYVGVDPPPQPPPPVQGDLWFDPEAVAYTPTGLRVDKTLQLGSSGGQLWGDNGDVVMGLGTISAEQARLTATGFYTETLWVSRVKALSVASGVLRLGSPGRTTFADGTLQANPPVNANDVVTKKYVDDAMGGGATAFVAKAGDTMTGSLTFSSPRSSVSFAGNGFSGPYWPNTNNLIYSDPTWHGGDLAITDWNITVLKPLGVAAATKSFHAVQKEQLDGKVNRSGDSMNAGYLSVLEPTSDGHVAQTGWVRSLVSEKTTNVNASYVNGRRMNFGNNVVQVDANGRADIYTGIANFNGVVVTNGHAEAYNGPVYVWKPNIGGDGSGFTIETTRLAGAHVRVTWIAWS